MNIEIWRDIDGYIGLYQVSNLGNVKSLNYRRTNNEKLLKPATNKNGYLFVVLSKNGKRKIYRVHRLVSEVFIPNPYNLPCIDHINAIRTDNRVDNLRWCTHKENSNNPKTKEKMSNSKKGKLSHSSKPIIQLSLNNDFIKVWDCSMDIQRYLGYKHQNISKCCLGKLNSAYGYKWCFAS